MVDNVGGAHVATPRPRIFGIAYDAVTENEAVELIIDRASSGLGGRVVTPNVDILRQATASDQMRHLVETADLVLADGMPIVWALRLQRTPVPERVAGSAIGEKLARAAAARGLGLFLLGGDPGVAEAAAARLRHEIPDLRVGWHCPPRGFEHDPVARRAIDTALQEFSPAVCFCGLGFPKQDLLGAQLLELFPSTWFMGVGATIGFLAGEVSRAPRWMQRAGLEWVYRLMLEPGRLAERYLRHDLLFAARMLLHATWVGLGREGEQ